MERVNFSLGSYLFACVMLASSVGYGGNVTMFQVHSAHSSRVTDMNLIETLTNDDDFPKVLRLRSGKTTKIPLLLETHRMKLRVKITFGSQLSFYRGDMMKELKV